MMISFFKRRYTCKHLDRFSIDSMQDTVSALVSRFDIYNGIGKEEVILAVKSVEVDAITVLSERSAAVIDLMKVIRIYRILLMHGMRVGDMTEQYPWLFLFAAVLILNHTLAPSQEQALIQGDVMVIGIVRSNVITQHYIAGRRMSACVHDLDISQGKGQRVVLGVPYLDHLFPTMQELSLGGAIPHGVIVHVHQERHIVVLIVFHDQFCREIGNLLLVHLLAPDLVLLSLYQKGYGGASVFYKNTSHFRKSIDVRNSDIVK